MRKRVKIAFGLFCTLLIGIYLLPQSSSGLALEDPRRPERTSPPDRDSLLARLEMVRRPEEARGLLRKLARRLSQGDFYGQETEIVHIIQRFWENPATPPDVLEAAWGVYSILLPFVAVQAPEMAESLFIHTPLAWTHAPDRHRVLLEVLYAAAMEPTLRDSLRRSLPPFLPLLIQVTLEDDGLLGNVLEVTLSAGRAAPLSVRFPPKVLRALLAYQGGHIWKIPDLLALDKSKTATEALLSLLERELHPTVTARFAKAGVDVEWVIRKTVLEKLAGRRLTVKQQRQLLGWFLNSQFAGVVANVIQGWEQLPAPSEAHIPMLEAYIRQKPGLLCRVAVRLLAAAGPEGLQRLFMLKREEREGTSISCSWDLWTTLRAHALEMAPFLETTFRKQPEPWILDLLAFAGRWGPIIETLRQDREDLRRAAILVLAAAVSPEGSVIAHGDPEGARMLGTMLRRRAGRVVEMQRVLRTALDAPDPPFVRGEARRALLTSGDDEAWAEVEHLLHQGGTARLRILEELKETRLPLPDSIVSLLVHVAEKGETLRARLLALEVLRKMPEAAERLTPYEGRIRRLLQAPNADVRRAVAGYFVSVPARQEVTTAVLLDTTRDTDVYVRDSAATALGQARAWTPEQVAALAVRMKQGDNDEDVTRKLETAYLHALRQDPGSVDRLLEIILHRSGSARWRRTLRDGPSAAPPVAQALLKRLATLSLDVWGPPLRWGLGHGAMLKAILQEEEDPPPFTLILALVPRDLLDPWLVRQALVRPDIPLEMRLYLILQTQTIPTDQQAGVWNLWMQAVRAETGGEMVLILLERWGYAGVRMLVDRLWDDPEALKRAWRFLRKQESRSQLRGWAGSPSGPWFPKPTVQDLSWIETTLERLRPGLHDPRLAVVVDLLGIYELGKSPALRKAAFQTRIPTLLYRHLADPKECRAVAHALGSLHNRVLPPTCPSKSR